MEKKGLHFYNKSKLHYLLFGVKLNENYCWGQNVYAPCNGKIIKIEDGLKERKILHPVLDTLITLKNGFFTKANNLHPFLGNNIIMECENKVFAFLTHLKKDSIQVTVDENIKKRQMLAQVGHSGNSTAAHLHFHLMDNENILKAKGIPCNFEKFELYENNEWKIITNNVPKDKDRVRFNKE